MSVEWLVVSVKTLDLQHGPQSPIRNANQVQDGAPKIAKLRYMWLSSMLKVDISSIYGVYKPACNWGAHPVVDDVYWFWVKRLNSSPAVEETFSSSRSTISN